MSERDRALRGLSEDLQIARAFAALTHHLREMVRHRSSLVNLADDYIWLSMRAFRDSSVIHLWKVYDTQPNAHSLSWFVREHSVLDERARDEDLSKLSTANDDVRRLARIRNQLFAHRGRESSKRSERNILNANDISETEFAGMTARAGQILVRHSGERSLPSMVHTAREAIGQLVDLDVYLSDASRGRWGAIEQIQISVDGDVKAGGIRYPRG